MKSEWLEGSFVRTIVYGLVAAGIVHICATLATPYLLGTGAYDRLIAELPANRIVVLGPPTPQAQLLPFQEPHTHFALCRYDASQAPVAIKASLLSSGWTLALYSSGGDNFYVAPGQDQKVTEVSALLVPPGDQFTEMLAEQEGTTSPTAQPRALPTLAPRMVRTARGGQQGSATATVQVEVPSATGLLVVRAPVKGEGYRPAIEAALARASCTRMPVTPAAATPPAPPFVPGPAPGAGLGTPRPGP